MAVVRSEARTLAVAAVFALSCPVQAQIFHLYKMPLPPRYTLSTHYMFYILSAEDSPDASKGRPSVEFRALAAAGPAPQGYSSVQLALLPFSRYWSMLDGKRFCSSQHDVSMGLANRPAQLLLKKLDGARTDAEMGVSITTVPFQAQISQQAEIKKTGMYVLAFVNCGNFSGGTVSGAVAVRNNYGFVPANELNTLRLYGWLTVVYGLVLLGWLLAVVRHAKTLFYLQKGIVAIALFCWLEALLTWMTFADFNNTGNRREVLFVTALVFYTVKYVLAWRLLLLAALGAGVVLEDLDRKTSAALFAGSLVFMMQQCAWKIMMGNRFSHLLKRDFLVVSLLPGTFVYAVMFLWTMLALETLTKRLEDQKQEEVFGAFVATRRVVMVGMFLASCVVGLQVADLVYADLLSWKQQWLPVDGAPNFCFMLLLLAMMYIWWPSESSWRFRYEVQVNQDELPDGKDHFEFPQDEPDVEEELHEPDSSPLPEVGEERGRLEVHKKRNAVAPEPIGAFTDAAAEANGAVLL